MDLERAAQLQCSLRECPDLRLLEAVMVSRLCVRHHMTIVNVHGFKEVMRFRVQGHGVQSVPPNLPLLSLPTKFLKH